MDWMKKNPHLIVAIVAAIGLIAASGLLVMSAQGFDEKFAPVQTAVVPNEKIKPLELSELEQTQNELMTPVTCGTHEARLLVPLKYTLQDGKLIPASAGFRIDP